MHFIFLQFLLNVALASAETFKFDSVRLFEDTTKFGHYLAIDTGNWLSPVLERFPDGTIQMHAIGQADRSDYDFESNRRLTDNRILFVPMRQLLSMANDLPPSLITPGVGRAILREVSTTREQLSGLGFDLNLRVDPEHPLPKFWSPYSEIAWIVIPYDATQKAKVSEFLNKYKKLNEVQSKDAPDSAGILLGYMDLDQANTLLIAAKDELGQTGHIYRKLLDETGLPADTSVPDDHVQANGFARSLKLSHWLETIDPLDLEVAEHVANEIFYLEQFRSDLRMAHNLFSRPTPLGLKERYISNFTDAADELISRALTKLHSFKSAKATECLILCGFIHRAVWVRLPFLLMNAYDGKTYFDHWLNRLTDRVTWPMHHPREEWSYGNSHRVGLTLFPVALILADPTPASKQDTSYAPHEEYWGLLALGLKRNPTLVEKLASAILAMDKAAKEIQPHIIEERGPKFSQSEILHSLILGLSWSPDLMKDRIHPVFSKALYVEQAAMVVTELLSTAQWHDLSTPTYLALLQTATKLASDTDFGNDVDQQNALLALVKMQNSMTRRLLRGAFKQNEDKICATMLKAI